MSVATYFLVLLGVCAVLATPALAYAKRRGNLSLADCALPVAPVSSLLLALETMNPSAHVGFAFVVYPIACATLSVIVLYVRVFALGRKAAPRSLSLWILLTTCLTAFVLGAMLPPWYE